ncbi:MAG: formate dehydrogenase-N subunit alpha [bacterium]|nr:formate dehydrogenase-N subunit alpha [bacterium]
MEISRRGFLKVSSATTAGLLFNNLSLFDLSPTKVYAKDLRIKYGRETTTICPYCAVGCGQIVTSQDNRVINIEGDPDHPINQGALCSKGSALYQVANNKRRLTHVLYRAPGSSNWEKKSWDWALPRIARRIKSTRDKNFIEKDEKGRVVNRVEAIACIGGAALNNEECYLVTKLSRALGIVYLEHQARLCHSSTVAGLTESFGRGAMTNHWIDIGNSDCIMIIGSNAAENHPISFKWITKAKENGAKLISVDPRFTRTSSKADIYAPLRPGTDIAFIGGIINYCLQNELYHKEYVAEYTNAPFLIDPKFSFENGLFSGYNEEKRMYDKSTWRYQLDEHGIPKEDKTLEDKDCVFQLLKKHFSRYDIDTVCKITGTPKDVYLEIAKTYCATGKVGKAGTIMYAMGTTQHTHGTQNIRSYAILQLLLGNIGVAGGGINTLRGASNVQGSTDHAILFHILPGYLKCPTSENVDLAAYIRKWTPESKDPKSANWWQHTPKYIVSLLKAFYGDKAQKANDFCYQYLPKREADYSWISLFEAMYKDVIKGLLVFGQNPAVCGPNVTMERKALGHLDWMVVMDLWETETATFWKAPGVNPAEVKTEVFLLPAAASMEKEGSITNSGRWSQWRYKAVDPPGDAKEDLWILDKIYKEVKALYEKDLRATFPEPILDLNWDYGEEPDAHKVAKEINGYVMATGKLLSSFEELKDDGSTCSGNWLYCGSYTEEGNMAARRSLKDAPNKIGLYPAWAWCWPVNRRIIYNRASCDPTGKPWNPAKYVVKWTGPETKWIGDVPDGGWPPEEKHPFIMKPEGHAGIFGMGLADGPFPEHYEPMESPVKNLLSKQQNNPTFKIWDTPEVDVYGSPKRYPIIATTYRVSEHWQSGAMTRNLPWLCELMPDMFVEMSKSLAKRLGIKTGDKVEVVSARGKIEAYALVTDRIKPFRLNGKMVEQVCMPWHYGYCGIVQGFSANCLTPHVGDANTMIPEYKVFLCDVRKRG